MKKKDLGIYIHIPFCVRKCDYCDFPSAARSPEEQAWYMRMLTKEIRQFEALGSLYQVRTIFFGGGTPSLLDPIQIMRVMLLLRDQFSVEADAEITIECNPGTLTEEKLTAYRELGINRLSIGAQSANDAELKLLGRIHAWHDVPESVRLARKLGFSNINIDIMSGLPHQSLRSWQATLQKIADLEPEHISAYSLSIEKGTPFYDRYSTAEGESALPEDITEREMYYCTLDYLRSRGYHRYEISNYAREGFECRHNKAYWTGGEYLGVGLGAASYVDGRRFANPADWEAYGSGVTSAYRRYKETEPQSEKSAMEEFMFLGLRLDRGIRPEEFQKRFGKDYREIYGAVTDQLTESRLLYEKDGYIRLTNRGIDISNVVLSDFLL